MTLLHRVGSIVRSIAQRKRAEQDLNDEVQAFIYMAAAEEVRDGATPAEARRGALLQLGGVEQAKKRVRTQRHGAWLDDLGRDVRYGLPTAAQSRILGHDRDTDGGHRRQHRNVACRAVRLDAVKVLRPE